MKKNNASVKTLVPLRPHLKWIVVGFAIVISTGSILYTSSLVRQIKEREKRQIEIYARSIEFLATADDNFFMIFEEIVSSNRTIPVILADINGAPEDYKNLPLADKLTGNEKDQYLRSEMSRMKQVHMPISVMLVDDEGNTYGTKYIFYKNSTLLSQLKYYPFIQLSIIALFGFGLFLTLKYLTRVEQDQVWVGLAKETAHQLGTPLSSLMAWSEYFKSIYPDEQQALAEFDKDVDRLRTITDRFSSIGSEPQLTLQNIPDVIDEMVLYLQKRLSTKLSIDVAVFPDRELKSRINTSLFAWVVENLCKNAADAMDGKGRIQINILKANGNRIAIDVIDPGKGIPKSKLTDVFRPGFTTKKRGWGLGLTLAKRIIEQYHGGKIFVKQSEVNKGTTFRIYLNG